MSLRRVVDGDGDPREVECELLDPDHADSHFTERPAPASSCWRGCPPARAIPGVGGTGGGTELGARQGKGDDLLGPPLAGIQPHGRHSIRVVVNTARRLRRRRPWRAVDERASAAAGRHAGAGAAIFFVQGAGALAEPTCAPHRGHDAGSIKSGASLYRVWPGPRVRGPGWW
ncbi:unnamed protein product [Prorocentrum cordatum]|uniref:Uncharacterized protein n=1 Tax=Prorocentrum cordatum TaxID=2364126 RepID=A0ABN9PR60_9DINO|nr:unnamed protein product [Polarella glacialis]